ncbi:hypothetical protein P8864_19850 [Priestia flexa]|uniref:hypothetical protein n=1 Tax=Priestia flexa TaxID=86664 RepID=UPI000C23551C|nr:hypothetical protein [Priestia flexa]MEC0668112.1 hypothetical protein [Priestia flexa]
MEWSVGHSTPAGKRGKTEIPQRSEEAQVPPRGKRVTVAQWNERVKTNQRDGNSECSSFRSNHFVMSQTHFYVVKKMNILFYLFIILTHCLNPWSKIRYVHMKGVNRN